MEVVGTTIFGVTEDPTSCLEAPEDDTIEGDNYSDEGA
jgi:hypothetical protein